MVMRYLLFVGIFLLIFTSCDDGDVITLELTFDQELELCGDEDTPNYVLYDTKSTPNESLTLLFPSNVSTNKIFNPDETPFDYTLTINGSSNRFNYRLYDGDPQGLICEEIPDSGVTITEDYKASTGTVTFTSTYIDDDNDDIPSELEDLNGNGDLEDDDSDGDGIPNYKDADDDNDNVLTRNENPDPDGDGDISDAQDTDGDSIPDYLDTDDDGDGTLTRYEDANTNGNLFDDFQTGAVAPRFLDDTVSDEFVYDVLNPNTFERTVTTEVYITNVDLEIFSTDELFLGTYINDLDF